MLITSLFLLSWGEINWVHFSILTMCLSGTPVGLHWLYSIIFRAKQSIPLFRCDNFFFLPEWIKGMCLTFWNKDSLFHHHFSVISPWVPCGWSMYVFYCNIHHQESKNSKEVSIHSYHGWLGGNCKQNVLVFFFLLHSLSVFLSLYLINI